MILELEHGLFYIGAQARFSATPIEDRMTTFGTPAPATSAFDVVGAVFQEVRRSEEEWYFMRDGEMEFVVYHRPSTQIGYIKKKQLVAIFEPWYAFWTIDEGGYPLSQHVFSGIPVWILEPQRYPVGSIRIVYGDRAPSDFWYIDYFHKSAKDAYRAAESLVYTDDDGSLRFKETSYTKYSL